MNQPIDTEMRQADVQKGGPQSDELLFLDELTATFEEAGDVKRIQRLRSLEDKWQRGEVSVAVSGHFSAGKSTLINRLLGIEAMPSSPLPTSANVVRLCFGEPQAVAMNSDGTELRLPDLGPEATQQLQRWCRDGATVERVDVTIPAPMLAGGLVLYDTPGVDSTDERHEAQTQGILYMADQVVFVADYHHVLAEVNFNFLSELDRSGKQIVLVVNQMDKQDEREVDQATFARGVNDALDAYGLTVERVFFVSARMPDWPGNEVDALRAHLQRCQAHVLPSVLGLIEEHALWLADQAGDSPERIAKARATLALVLEHREAEQQAKREVQAAIEQLETELTGVIMQAILMPYEETEMAIAFVESLHTQFRAGVFSTRKRTQEEQERRLARMTDAIAKRVEEGLTRHLRQSALRFEREANLPVKALLAAIDRTNAAIDSAFLRQQVAGGAAMDRPYGDRYAKQVVAAIRSEFSRVIDQELNDLARVFVDGRTVANSDADVAEVSTLARVSQRSAHIDQLEKAAHAALGRGSDGRNVPATMDQAEAGAAGARGLQPSPSSLAEHDFDQPVSRQTAHDAGRRPASLLASLGLGAAFAGVPVPDAGGSQSGPSVPGLERTAQDGAEDQAAALCVRLRKAADLADESRLLRVATSLRERARRIAEAQYTVALFGAFSSGKSTLINALLGAALMPVSPSPATAVICRVMRVTPEHVHNTAVARYKTREDLLSEVRAAADKLGVSVADLGGLARGLEGGRPAELASELRPYWTFLECVRDGWERNSSLFGQSVSLEDSAWPDVIATESRAAFVERVDVYFDCALTQAGLILVDTPGADSIHARHTDLAFRYLRDADAVVFVTYFNHAFSRADREFLEQVGRVKEALAYDSLHVVINACDLADSERDVRDVRAYVDSSLHALGVRQPRLYTVSSGLALAGLTRGTGESIAGGGDAPLWVTRWLTDSPTVVREGASDTSAVGLRKSLQDLYDDSGVPVLTGDLLVHTRVRLFAEAARAADAELRRARGLLESRLQDIARSTESARQDREAGQLAITAWREAWGKDPTREIEAIGEELGELFYHIRQRLQFRHQDMVVRAFHQSVLVTGSERESEGAVREWFRLVTLALGQEARATAIRVGRFVQSLAAQRAERAAVALQIEGFPGFVADELMPTPDVVPDPPVPAAGEMATAQRTVRAQFRSPEHFFEKGGRTALCDDLTDCAKRLTESYLDRIREEFMKTYSEWLTDVNARQCDERVRDVEEWLQASESSEQDADTARRLTDALANWPVA
ncbi:MAG: dynamin family protein [Firmicutes bacterium]|nr:dynamin family protein [Bacillota bacterium]